MCEREDICMCGIHTDLYDAFIAGHTTRIDHTIVVGRSYICDVIQVQL
jgi:hypothetical protein